MLVVNGFRVIYDKSKEISMEFGNGDYRCFKHRY